MGDEEVGQAEFLLQLTQQVDHLRLDGHIQCGDRFVADNEVRVQGESSCNADALALSAGEFMGIAALVVFRQAAGVHHAGDVVIELPLRNNAMLPHSLADDLAHGQTRGEAGIGVLKDNLYPGTELTQFLLAERKDILSVYSDLAGGLFQQAEDRAATSAFATSTLAHKAHSLAAFNFKADSVYRLDIARRAFEKSCLDGEIFDKIINFKQIILLFHYSSSTFTDFG